MKKHLLHIPDSLTKTLTNKHLLLDTSFFIDAVHHKQAFDEFVTLCHNCQATLVTIQPVLIEFFRGAASATALSKRTTMVEEYVGKYIVPISPRIFEDQVIFMVERYGKAGARVSLTDFLLAAVTKQHKNDLLLLTKNSLDFPMEMFELESYFLLQNVISRTVQPYCLYRYHDGETTKQTPADYVPF